jgi:hypothetical protein
MKFDIYLLDEFSINYNLYLESFFSGNVRIQPNDINLDNFSIIIFNEIYFNEKINIDFINDKIIVLTDYNINDYLLYIKYLKSDMIKYKPLKINAILTLSKNLEGYIIDKQIYHNLSINNDIFTTNKMNISLLYPKIINELKDIFSITDNFKEIMLIIKTKILFNKKEIDLYFENNIDINLLKKIHYFCNDLKNYISGEIEYPTDFTHWRNELIQINNIKTFFIPKCFLKNISIDFFPRNIIVYGSSFNTSWQQLNPNFKHYTIDSNDELTKLKLLYKYGGYLIPSNIECTIPIEHWDFLDCNDFCAIDNNILICTSYNYKIKKLIRFLQNKDRKIEEFKYLQINHKYLEAYFHQK